jgi:hybrid cluster-associated redox disulfide protein
MEKPVQFEMQMSVADLMRNWPQTIPVFLKHNMACVGCSMSAFETLKDAARIYGIALDTFMGELQEAVKPRDA